MYIRRTGIDRGNNARYVSFKRNQSENRPAVIEARLHEKEISFFFLQNVGRMYTSSVGNLRMSK